MILICGGIADSVTELVCARLNDCGYPYRLLDLGLYPRGFQASWSWSHAVPYGFIEGPDWKLDLDEISGVYARYLGLEGRTSPPGVPEISCAAVYHEYDTGLMTMLEDLPAVVVNRVTGGMSNNSKPYQALQVRKSGLLTPPTLITSDPAAARQFYDECNAQVIYKSLSGVRSIVRRLTPEQLDRLPLLRNGAAQFQQYIPGDNVRVHTVGDEIFATRVRSEAVDYRYARHEGHEVTMEPAVLPPDVAEACLLLASMSDLVLAGIDLKQTPAGEYYCFEVNPCPGFIYYEKYSGQPISKALVDLLRRGLPSQGCN